MKRSATESIVDGTTSMNHQLRPRRKTRAVARLEAQAEQAAAKQKRKEDERANRAANSSPFESCFSIMIKNGFLFRHECLWIASTSKSCNDVWEENKETLPEKCLVEIKLYTSDRNVASTSDRSVVSDIPAWMNRIGLTKETIGSTHFVKHVFDYINRLRIESKGKLTAYKRRQEEAKLLTWGGKQVQVATVHYWAANNYNDGGICIATGHKSQLFREFYFNGRSLFKCRLTRRLKLWTATAIGKRGWDLYRSAPRLSESVWTLNEPSIDSSLAASIARLRETIAALDDYGSDDSSVEPTE